MVVVMFHIIRNNLVEKYICNKKICSSKLFKILLARGTSNVILKRKESSKNDEYDYIYPLTTDKDGYLPLRIDQAPADIFHVSKLNVTTLTLPYCELRSLYERCQGERRVSKAMAAGTKAHAKLEKVALDKAQVKVIKIPNDIDELLSKEERWAQKIIGQITTLRALKEGHTVRELYVHGILGGFLITGYIDEINPNNGLVDIVDIKTRTSSLEPDLTQRLSAYHQVQIYYELLRQMTSDPLKNFEDLYSHMALDPLKTFGLDFQNFLKDNLCKEYSNLKSLESELVAILKYFDGEISDILRVKYITLGGKLKGEASYQYDYSALAQLIDYSLGFWKGTRSPLGVSSSEIQKCTNCTMRSKCKWSELLHEKIMNMS